MAYLAAQPYIKIKREVTSTKQIDTEHDRMLYLYANRIVTEHREFPLADVIDVSSRKFGTTNGLLYIHTSSGLFSYTVKTSVEEFINIYKKHVEKLK